RVLDFPRHELGGIEQLQLLIPDGFVTTEHILSLALGGIAVHCKAVDLLAQLARAPLRLLDRATRCGKRRSRDLLARRALTKLLAERGKLGFQLSAGCCCFR